MSREVRCPYELSRMERQKGVKPRGELASSGRALFEAAGEHAHQREHGLRGQAGDRGGYHGSFCSLKTPLQEALVTYLRGLR